MEEIVYNEKEELRIELNQLKHRLEETDFKAIKFAEGVITYEQYQPIKKERENWRKRINEIEKKLGA